ncbi:MAG: NADH:ubiquinone oxidoreductase subunit NDUFA12 [Sphingomonadaceae bacterium]
MNILTKIFGWWDGATFGTWLNTVFTGEEVGTDIFGNRYYRSRKPNSLGRQRRWVIYKGINDASHVPAEWHNWLHGAFDNDTVPESNLPPARVWETEYTPNVTGTSAAYRPAGALERGGQRAKATGDYQSWSPDA